MNVDIKFKIILYMPACAMPGLCYQLIHQSITLHSRGGMSPPHPSPGLDQYQGNKLNPLRKTCSDWFSWWKV